MTKIETMSLSTPAGDAVRDNYRNQGATAERERIIKLLEPLFDKAENAETRRLLIMAIATIKAEIVQEPSVSTNPGQTEIMDKTQSERERIIALIERRICFDALADDDGRCEHHGGKCYDLRQLIKDLQRGN